MFDEVNLPRLNDFFIKVNESRCKQRGVTPHASTGQNLLKKILRKDKY